MSQQVEGQQIEKDDSLEQTGYGFWQPCGNVGIFSANVGNSNDDSGKKHSPWIKPSQECDDDRGESLAG